MPGRRPPPRLGMETLHQEEAERRCSEAASIPARFVFPSGVPHAVRQSEEAPQCAVLWLHGAGADGQSQTGALQWMAQKLPGCTFLCPTGPGVVLKGDTHRGWFRCTLADGRGDADGLRQAADYAADLVDEVAATAGVPRSKVAVVGHNQGGLVAIYAALRPRDPPPALQREPVAGACALGVCLPDWCPPLPPAGAAGSPPPPLLLLHGKEDKVIPVRSAAEARDALAAGGHPAELRIVDGMTHDYQSFAMMEPLRDWLAERLGVAPPRSPQRNADATE
eukprot:TRINITY_DN65931_c0_g1_i1.p3 TRINITY_DN65931_c0_g1~~TRINITY_DN65931_c0_g1_i1.p3  ORF type:complete len:279 (+),score=71.67 TRINITY_DN65931_c0_g1_i1:81-917(+)